MVQSYRNAKKADVLVLGTDLTSLLVAESFRQSGRDVTLVDTEGRLNGDSQTGVGRSWNFGLDYFPSRPETKELLTWLADLLHHEINWREREVSPVTFDEGLFKPFVGFGDQVLASRDEIGFYLAPTSLELNFGLEEILRPLLNPSRFACLTGKQVTRLICEAGRVEGVELNGADLWKATEIVAPFGPSDLLALLPHEIVDTKLRHRLSKAHTWSAVTLRLHHSTSIMATEGIHVLFGHGHEAEPVLGRFLPPLPDASQTSIWLTLVPDTLADDGDTLGHALRHLKRQLKRAYHTAFEDLREEKVVVVPEAHGHFDLKGKPKFHLPELANLLLITPLQSTWRGPLASLDIAHQVASDLTVRVPTLESSPETTQPIV